MTDANLIAQIGTISLYADMDERERAELSAGMRYAHFSAGEVLMQQGADPDGAYFIISGQVQVLTRLPGGGETAVAALGPGSTIGELALVRAGRRTATVRAVGAVEVIFAERDYFRAAMAQLRPAAMKVLRQLARIQSGRLGMLHRKIHESVAGNDRAYASIALPVAPDLSRADAAKPDFGYADFLHILPCFRNFDPVALAAVRDRSEPLIVPRGVMLWQSETAPEHCFVVVRGAVASGFVDNGRLHQLNVLGPGRFCAIGPMLEKLPTDTCYLVRENAVLLRLAREPVLELYLGTDRTALLLLRAVNEHLAEMVSRANNHLTRLVGLSRLSRQLSDAAGIGVNV